MHARTTKRMNPPTSFHHCATPYTTSLTSISSARQSSSSIYLPLDYLHRVGWTRGCAMPSRNNSTKNQSARYSWFDPPQRVQPSVPPRKGFNKKSERERERDEGLLEPNRKAEAKYIPFHISLNRRKRNESKTQYPIVSQLPFGFFLWLCAPTSSVARAVRDLSTSIIFHFTFDGCCFSVERERHFHFEITEQKEKQINKRSTYFSISNSATKKKYTQQMAAASSSSARCLSARPSLACGGVAARMGLSRQLRRHPSSMIPLAAAAAGVSVGGHCTALRWMGSNSNSNGNSNSNSNGSDPRTPSSPPPPGSCFSALDGPIGNAPPLPPSPPNETLIRISAISGEDLGEVPPLVWPLGREPATTTSGTALHRRGYEYASFQRSLYATVRNLTPSGGCCAAHGRLRSPPPRYTARSPEGSSGCEEGLTPHPHEIPLLPLQHCPHPCGGCGSVCSCTALLYREPNGGGLRLHAAGAAPYRSSRAPRQGAGRFPTPEGSGGAPGGGRSDPLQALLDTRDQLLFAVKLAGLGPLLEAALGPKTYRALVGRSGVGAEVVNLCARGVTSLLREEEDRRWRARRMTVEAAASAPGDETGRGVGQWGCRTLLSVRDHNRLMFQMENASHPSQVAGLYSNALNLASLYTMWSIASSCSRSSRTEEGGGGPWPGRTLGGAVESNTLSSSSSAVAGPPGQTSRLPAGPAAWGGGSINGGGGARGEANDAPPPSVPDVRLILHRMMQQRKQQLREESYRYFYRQQQERFRAEAAAGTTKRPSFIPPAAAPSFCDPTMMVPASVWSAGAGMDLIDLALLYRLTEAEPGLVGILLDACHAVLQRLEAEEAHWRSITPTTAAGTSSSAVSQGTQHSEEEEEEWLCRNSSSRTVDESGSTAALRIEAVSLQQLGVSTLLLGLLQEMQRVLDTRLRSGVDGEEEMEIGGAALDDVHLCPSAAAPEDSNAAASTGSRDHPPGAADADGGTAPPSAAGSATTLLEEVDARHLCQAISSILRLRQAESGDKEVGESEDWGGEESATEGRPHRQPFDLLPKAHELAVPPYGAVLHHLALRVRHQCLIFLCGLDLSWDGGKEELRALVRWLLREAPLSTACVLHFGELAAFRQGVALDELRRSGLVATDSARGIARISRVLLPLLLRATNPEFMTTVANDLLLHLEMRLDGPGTSFTVEELDRLAELGTALYTLGEGSSGSMEMSRRAPQLTFESFGSWMAPPMALFRAIYSWIRNTLTHDIRSLWESQEERKMRSSKNQKEKNGKIAPKTAPHAGREISHQDDDGESLSTATPSEEFGDSPHSTTSRATGQGVAPASSLVPPPRWVVPQPIRQRFLTFLENLIQCFVLNHRPVSSTRLVEFVHSHVPVPNIQDEYRRKLYFLVNVTPEKDDTKPQSLKSSLAAAAGMNNSLYADEEVPQELRLLVSSLPHTLSPYASVAILRDVLSKSAGSNARYTYVCKAALDLQLPVSTTRSRVATAMNMWSFLRTQSTKLPYTQLLLMQKRCLINFPLSYIWSSYWVVLSWTGVLVLILLHFFGMDYESSLLAKHCQREFGLPVEMMAVPVEKDDTSVDSMEDWDMSAHLGMGARSVNLLLTPAFALFPSLGALLGSDRGSLKAALYIVDGDDFLPPASNNAEQQPAPWWRRLLLLLCGLKFTDPCAEDQPPAFQTRYQQAMYLIANMCKALRYPFFVDMEKPLPIDLLEARVAERMRRISSNHTWFWLRPVVRFFPLGIRKTEVGLIEHTCARAERHGNRVTFLIYIHDGVPVTLALLEKLRAQSWLSKSANIVVVAHQNSLDRGGVTSGAGTAALQAAYQVKHTHASPASAARARKLREEQERMQMRPANAGVNAGVEKVLSRAVTAVREQVREQVPAAVQATTSSSYATAASPGVTQDPGENTSRNIVGDTVAVVREQVPAAWRATTSHATAATVAAIKAVGKVWNLTKEKVASTHLSLFFEIIGMTVLTLSLSDNENKLICGTSLSLFFLFLFFFFIIKTIICEYLLAIGQRVFTAPPLSPSHSLPPETVAATPCGSAVPYLPLVVGAGIPISSALQVNEAASSTTQRTSIVQTKSIAYPKALYPQKRNNTRRKTATTKKKQTKKQTNNHNNNNNHN
eukprot:gene844-481_t